MREFSFYLLFVSAIIPIIQAYRKPEEIYQLPFLYSIALMVYILPTLFGTMSNDAILSDSEYMRYTFFSAACFWTSAAGYRFYQPKKSSLIKQPESYNEKKLLIVLYIFLLLSFAAFLDADTYDPESRYGGSYAIITYVLRFMRPATIMLFILWLLKPSKGKFLFLLISLICSLKIILIDGRRSEVFNLFITIAFPLFFVKNKLIPRASIVPAIVGALFVFTFLPAARQYTLKGDYSSVFKISPKDLILSQINAENTNEVVEAAKNMEVTALSGNYNYGSTVYNGFVIQFASATVFGDEFKNSLMISTNLNLEDLRNKYAKYNDSEYRFYLAPTGFAAVFFEFGYAGIILFFLFGIITRYFYDKASQRRDLFSVIFYCFFATFILFSIYDSILSIPSMIVLYLIIFYVSKWYGRIKSEI